VLVFIGLVFYLGGSALAGTVTFGAMGALMTGVITTYDERKRIYEDAVQASGNLDATGPRLRQYAPFRQA